MFKKNKKDKGIGSVSLSCYEITTKQMMLGRGGNSLTLIKSVLKYMKLFKTYEYRHNPARGVKTHYIDSSELVRWNKQVLKNLGKE